MQTIQLQCGSCKNMMAIQVEHLGKAVRCPHCKSVVQTPSAPPEPPPPAPPPLQETLSDSELEEVSESSEPGPNWLDQGTLKSEVTVRERESIFTGPEPSEDLFANDSDSPPPRVEMPGEPTDMPAPAPRAIKQSNAVLYFMIFLIPYSLCATGYVAYLLSNWPKATGVDTLEYLQDSFKDKTGKEDQGAPKRKDNVSKTSFPVPNPDLPLRKENLVKLKETWRIGDIEVTPHKVVNVNTALALYLEIKNVSSDVTFAPITHLFLLNARNKIEKNNYTYLQFGGNGKNGGAKYMISEVAGFRPVRLENDVEIGDPIPGSILAPGEVGLFKLETQTNEKEAVEKELKAAPPDELLTWRVQLRRGFVPFRGELRSATALVGVQFTPKEILSN